MLLRNLNLNRAKRLMIGTHLIVKACLEYNIEAEIITGAKKRRVLLLPRINLTCRNTCFHFICQAPIPCAPGICIDHSPVARPIF